MEQDENESGVARSQNVVHMLPSGDARAAGVVAPLLERVNTEEAGVQLLVLAPGADVASWIARGVNAARSRSEALLIAVTAPTRTARRLAAGARAIVAAPADALSLIRGSALKLESIRAFVIVDANDVLAASGEEVAAIVSELPKDCTRVLIARDGDEKLDAFVEATMRRARRIPHDAATATEARLQYVVATPAERATILGRILDTLDPPRTTIVADADQRGSAADVLAALGYGEDDASVRVSDGSDITNHEPLVVLFGAPTSAQSLQAIMATQAAATVALVAPGELSDFLRITGGSAAPLALSPTPASARAAEERLRDELRAVLHARSLHREVLALEPILGEFDAVEVAAAALRLLDVERAKTQQHKRQAARASERGPEPQAVSVPQERLAPAGTTFTRLFVNIGERDGVKKGDFVGAITNEAGLTAEHIGKIELRDSHSLVEVSAESAEKVITALTGSTIRGRHVIARADREPSGQEGGRERSSRPERFERADRGGFRGDRGSDRGGDRGGDRGSDRGDRGSFRGGSGGSGGSRGGDRPGGDRGGFRGPPRGGPRSGFGGPPRERGGFRDREQGSGGGSRGGDRDRGAAGGGFRGGPPRGGRRDDSGAPPRRSFDRDETRGPRAIGESREWGERGDRLKNARGKRREE